MKYLSLSQTGTGSFCMCTNIINWEFSEPKEHVIAKPVRRLVVAISKGFHLNFVGFSLCSEGIATSGFALLAMTAYIYSSIN